MDNSNQFVLADHKQATIDLTNEIKRNQRAFRRGSCEEIARNA